MTDAFLLSAERQEAIGRSYNIAGDAPVSFKALVNRYRALRSVENYPKVIFRFLVANLASDIFSVIPGLQGETRTIDTQPCQISYKQPRLFY